jgi:hypothetical protein
MRITLIALCVAAVGFTANAQEERTPTAWLTFDDATCGIIRHSGSDPLFTMAKGEGFCTVAPKSETHRNAGLIVIEKNQAPKVIALPGISNLSNLFPIPKPVIPNDKRTILILN